MHEAIISKEDCTGCGLCTKVCPGKLGNNALELTPNKEISDLEKEVFNNHINKQALPKSTIKGSQLNKSLFEFSGACAGCGEPGYIKNKPGNTIVNPDTGETEVVKIESQYVETITKVEDASSQANEIPTVSAVQELIQ